MIKKILSTLFAVMLGVIATSIQPAEAHRRGGVAVGVGLGLLGLGLIASARGPYGYAYGPGYGYGYGPGPGGCYPGPRQCGWSGPRQCFPDHYGNPICRGGHYRCWRPTICD